MEFGLVWVTTLFLYTTQIREWVLYFRFYCWRQSKYVMHVPHQVLAILARPDKTSKVRRFWNWYHHNIGRAAILVAVGNVFLGLSIAQETNAYIVSYGVFVAVWVVAVAAFEVKRCYADDD